MLKDIIPHLKLKITPLKRKFQIVILLLITTHSHALTFDKEPILVNDKLSFLRTISLLQELMITTGNLAIMEKNSNKAHDSDVRYKAEICTQIRIAEYMNRFIKANESFIQEMNQEIEDYKSINDNHIRVLSLKLDDISCDQIYQKDQINWKTL